MKLTLCTLLASVALLSPESHALTGDLSLNLQYGVRDAEALYAVTTEKGDLRFMNQGPGAAKVRWYDPLRGQEEARVLAPGQALVHQGQLGVTVSLGTAVLVEKVGPGVVAAGLASIPTAPSLRDSVHCLHNNGAFLPWHRGLYAAFEGIVGGTMCSIESHRGAIGSMSVSPGAAIALTDGAVRVLMGDDPLQHLGGQEGEDMHGSAHCFTQPTDGDDIFMPKADGFIIGVPSCPELEHGPGLQGSIQLDGGHTLRIVAEYGSVSLELGSGPHGLSQSWLPCPPYEPCDDTSIWGTGPIHSIAPDGWVDL